MNIADTLQINETIRGQSAEEWVSMTNDKNVSYVNDQQNGSYSNQFSFDLTSIVSQGSSLALQEGYIVAPIVTELTVSGDNVTNVVSTDFCPKSNFINFIDSVQLFVNGEQLIDQTPFSNFAINVMDTLTSSIADQKKVGSAVNFIPDKTTSIKFSNFYVSGGVSGSTLGDGYINTDTTNTSFAERASMFYSSESAVPSSTGYGASPLFSTSQTNAQQTLIPYFSKYASAPTHCAWTYIMLMPLNRINNLLENYPMVKSASQIRLVINFNAGTSVMTASAGPLFKHTSYTSSAGNTCTSLLNTSHLNANNATITLKTSICSVPNQTATASKAKYGFPSLTSCRLYVPTYKLNPMAEARLLSNQVQKIRYYDWYQQPILNVSSGSSFNQVITTALPNVQTLIIVPFQNPNGSASNVTPQFANRLYSSASINIPQFQSCTDSAPATSLPGAMSAFQNFNVSVSGINIFNQNQNYCYDNWVQEVQKFGLNGGLNKQLDSGLWDLTTWNYSPFVVADLSRRDQAADKTYQSVVVSGTNGSAVNVDYYCFVAYQKEIEIDILTGAVKRIMN